MEISEWVTLVHQYNRMLKYNIISLKGCLCNSMVAFKQGYVIMWWLISTARKAWCSRGIPASKEILITEPSRQSRHYHGMTVHFSHSIKWVSKVSLKQSPLCPTITKKDNNWWWCIEVKDRSLKTLRWDNILTQSNILEFQTFVSLKEMMIIRIRCKKFLNCVEWDFRGWWMKETDVLKDRTDRLE
jgi:hypothetical protein